MPRPNKTVSTFLRKIAKGSHTFHSEHSGSVQIVMFADRADEEAFRRTPPAASPWKGGDGNPCAETSFGIFDAAEHVDLARP
jgi:hypothetical protein